MTVTLAFTQESALVTMAFTSETKHKRYTQHPELGTGTDRQGLITPDSPYVTLRPQQNASRMKAVI